MTAKKAPKKAKKRGTQRPGKPARAPGALSEQQLLFCLKVVERGGENSRQAAIDAGYAAAGAHVRACRLLKDPRIRDKIAELTARAAAEATAQLEQAGVAAIAEQAITAETERSKIDLAVETLKARVMKRLESIAFTELPELATWTEDSVTFTPSDQLSETARGSVLSIESKQDEVITDEGDKILRRTTLKVKQHPPMPALEKLMQLCHMLPKEEPKPGSAIALGVQVIVSGGPTGIETGAIPAENIAPAPHNIAGAAVASAAPRPWNPGTKVRTSQPSQHPSPALAALAERARRTLAATALEE